MSRPHYKTFREYREQTTRSKTVVGLRSKFNQTCPLLFYTILLIVLINLIQPAEAKRKTFDTMLADFLLRSDEQWRSAWHTDCHRRCRHELDSQIRLACAKDIYRIRRSSDGISNSTRPNKIKKHLMDKKSANAFLHKLHSQPIRMKRGIMEECCYAKSCTWEEFAESCHHYGRNPASETNTCR